VRFEPIPGGYRVFDANALALAHVYGEPQAAVAKSPNRLTDDQAEKIARLPDLVELERDRNRARNSRKRQLLRNLSLRQVEEVQPVRPWPSVRPSRNEATGACRLSNSCNTRRHMRRQDRL
jgi:hypothetical protein